MDDYIAHIIINSYLSLYGRLCRLYYNSILFNLCMDDTAAYIKDCCSEIVLCVDSVVHLRTSNIMT